MNRLFERQLTRKERRKAGMKQITRIRKVVCVMANELKKAGYSLSDTFKKTYKRMKLSMHIQAAGTTFRNR